LAASQSQILDVDYASESANMTRYQIQSQAGVAALAQAKAIPQSIISLLS
jgi:flagellin